ncbi:hypothetical protein [Nesterenkonia alba]|uniref:hypothetical protein n=1 Tax=Nesterenkonia alba TaxID=515814 RepID=UPI0003B51CCC|nr:hypothetical protein [Nesterenkonia alba]
MNGYRAAAAWSMVMALGLTACGGEELDAEGTETQTPPDETEPQEPDDTPQGDGEQTEDQSETEQPETTETPGDAVDHDGLSQAEEEDLPGEPTQSQFAEEGHETTFVGVPLTEDEAIASHVLPDSDSEVLFEESPSPLAGITTGRERLHEDIHWVELQIPEVGYAWYEAEVLGFVAAGSVGWLVDDHDDAEIHNRFSVTEDFELTAAENPADAAEQIRDQVEEQSEADAHTVLVNVTEDEIEWTFDHVMEGEGPVLGERYYLRLQEADGLYDVEAVEVSTLCENPLSAEGECA